MQFEMRFRNINPFILILIFSVILPTNLANDEDCEKVCDLMISSKNLAIYANSVRIKSSIDWIKSSTPKISKCNF